MTADELIDAMGTRIDDMDSNPWNSARAALAAIDAAGWQVVPKEPIEEMVAAGWASNGHFSDSSPLQVWQAMLAAAPKVTP